MKSLDKLNKDKIRYIEHLEIGNFKPFKKALYLYFGSTYPVIQQFRLLQSTKSKLLKLIFTITYKILSILTGIQINPNTSIGGGCYYHILEQ